MESIRLINACPSVFEGQLPASGKSEIWGCDLEFKKGEKILVKAASGRGKTSLCSFLSGLRTDYDGDILIDGIQVKETSPGRRAALRRENMAILFQELRLFENLDAVENVMVRTRLDGKVEKEEIIQRLSALGLDSDMISRPCRTLSLGQMQRVAFVRMICSRADFRILDEPVSHLDRDCALKMSEMLSETASKDGSGIIVTSVGYDFPMEYDRTYNL